MSETIEQKTERCRNLWQLSTKSNPLAIPRTERVKGIHDRLWNQNDPNYLLQREKPWHRTAQELAMGGMTNKEIAETVGRTQAAVCQVLKQPFAQERMIVETKRKLADEMKEFLEAEIMPTLQLYKEVRDNTLLKAEVRITAAARLEDRFLGKAAQPIVSELKPVENLSDDELKSRANDVLARYGSLAGVSESTGG